MMGILLPLLASALNNAGLGPLLLKPLLQVMVILPLFAVAPTTVPRRTESPPLLRRHK
jgi:hypothetical protein